MKGIGMKCQKFALAVALTAVSVAVVACSSGSSGSSTSGGQKVTITYATPAGGGQPEIKLYNDLIAQFERLHPDIVVKQDVIPATSDPQFWQKLQVEAAGNQYPDLTYVHESWFPQAVSVNYFNPLDSGTTNAGLDTKAFFGTAVQQLSSGGHLYAAPRETSTIAVYYNATIFQKANVETPTQYAAAGQWNWNTFKTVAQKLTDKANHQYGAIAPVDVPYGLFSTIYSFGGNLLNSANSKAEFSSPQDINALAFLHSIIADGSAVLPAQNTKLNLFANGKVGMYISGYWDVALTGGAIKTFTWDVAPLPTGTTDLTRSASAGYGIPAKASHPQQALEFLKFLETQQSVQYLAKLGLIIPAMKSVAESPQFLQPNAEPAHRSVFIQQLAHGRLDPEVPQWSQVVDAITNGTDPIWSGAQTPSQAASQISQQIDSELGS